MPSPHPPPRVQTTLFSPSSELDITQAATALRNVHLIAFPTETFYGLGADATNTALLSRAAVPVADPSANTSGRPSPTSAAHVMRDLNGAVYCVVDGGQLALEGANFGLESTFVDMTDPDHPAVLRPGADSMKELEHVSGVTFRRLNKAYHDQGADNPKAPGMKYRHYAPVAPLHVVEWEALERRVQHERRRGKLWVYLRMMPFVRGGGGPRALRS